jgi:hypothetical protein
MKDYSTIEEWKKEYEKNISTLTPEDHEFLRECNKPILFIKSRRKGYNPNVYRYLELQEKLRQYSWREQVKFYQKTYEVAWSKLDELLRKENLKIRGL